MWGRGARLRPWGPRAELELLKGPAGGWRLWGRSQGSLATPALLRRPPHRRGGDAMWGTLCGAAAPRATPAPALLGTQGQAGRKQEPEADLLSGCRSTPVAGLRVPAQRWHCRGAVPRGPQPTWTAGKPRPRERPTQGGWGRRRRARGQSRETGHGQLSWVFIDAGSAGGASAPGGPAGTQGPALGLQQEGLRLQRNRDHRGESPAPTPPHPGASTSWLLPSPVAAPLHLPLGLSEAP